MYRIVAFFLGLWAISSFAQLPIQQHSKTDSTHGTSIAPVEMESVTILAPRKDIGQIAHLSGSEILLSEQDIKRFDQVDGNQILQTLPGVYTQQEDGWGLRLNVGLRGTGVLRSSRVTLMEDGVLTSPAPYASPAAYYTPAMWKYQNIEILKGSSQLIAGPQTTGGAINMLTPVLDEKNDLMVTSAFGNYGQIRNFIQGEWKIAKRTSIGLALNRSQANGFKQFNNEAVGGYALNDGYLKIGHHLDERDLHHLELYFGGTQERSNQSYVGLSLADAQSNPRKQYFAANRDSMILDRSMLRFSYTANLKKGWFRADVYRQGAGRNWYKLDKVDAGNGAIGIASILMDPVKYAQEFAAMDGVGGDSTVGYIKANRRQYKSQGMQLRGLWTENIGSIKFTQEAGLRMHYDEEDRFQESDKYSLKNSIQLLENGAQGEAGNRIDFASAQSAYYRATASYRSWTLQAGLRGENILVSRVDFGKSNAERDFDIIKLRENRTQVLLPGISLNKSVGSWTIFSGIHKGFTPAGSKEGVLPEESINSELGIKHRKLPIQLTAFHSDYRRLLGSDMAASGGTGSGDLFNSGSALIQGLEARAGWIFDAFEIQANATYTDARFTKSFKSSFDEWNDVESGDKLPYMPTWQGGITASYGWKGLNIFTQLVYQSDRKSSADLEVADLPASVVVNAGMGYSLTKQWSVKLSLQNVSNEQHVVAARPAGYRLYAPRMILGSLTFQL